MLALTYVSDTVADICVSLHVNGLTFPKLKRVNVLVEG
jgi:hypothetical protein